ncbi:hypothetical protein CERZMDRAFT_94805 [Cercospora zeae-maydis SCOH1-5]|uniref:Uncharacterized protein n=1 Tax=Cercospora zeae-maydis SCOH1-5 TaxID=717836 RepID=A0A6A6FPN4_9PEZI|nr:hypothetical protein CERZMDRAFT_94805 [Cercospora zeae-maydis SCOH1-5]
MPRIGSFTSLYILSFGPQAISSRARLSAIAIIKALYTLDLPQALSTLETRGRIKHAGYLGTQAAEALMHIDNILSYSRRIKTPPLHAYIFDEASSVTCTRASTKQRSYESQLTTLTLSPTNLPYGTNLTLFPSPTQSWYKTFFLEILPDLHPFHPFITDLSHHQALCRIDPQDVSKLQRIREILSNKDNSDELESAKRSAIFAAVGGLLFLTAFFLPWIWEPESIIWAHWCWLFLGTANILCGVRLFPWYGNTVVKKRTELEFLEKWERERKNRSPERIVAARESKSQNAKYE